MYSTAMDGTVAADDEIYAGAPLGRRERDHGPLRTIADIRIDQVIEPVTDLAVADRVAWVLARRTGRTHVVIATASCYLIATTTVDLTGADALRVTPSPDLPITSIATPTGIVPLLSQIKV
jgi:hypothetical protein